MGPIIELRGLPLGALLYFTSVVAVVFLAAVVIINRRDP
jgi:hypothetical protein